MALLLDSAPVCVCVGACVCVCVHVCVCMCVCACVCVYVVRDGEHTQPEEAVSRFLRVPYLDKMSSTFLSNLNESVASHVLYTIMCF